MGDLYKCHLCGEMITTVGQCCTDGSGNPKNNESLFVTLRGEDKIINTTAFRKRISIGEYKTTKKSNRGLRECLDEIDRLEARLAESEKAREEAGEDRDVYKRCLDGSTKAKYTAELYDRQVIRAEAAESRLSALQEENVRYRKGLADLVAFVKCHKKYIPVRMESMNTRALSAAQDLLSTTPETAKVQAVIDAAKEQEFLSSVPGGNVPSYTNACDKTNKAVRAFNE